eukprot:Rmarinus@m.14706
MTFAGLFLALLLAFSLGAGQEFERDIIQYNEELGRKLNHYLSKGNYHVAADIAAYQSFSDATPYSLKMHNLRRFANEEECTKYSLSALLAKQEQPYPGERLVVMLYATIAMLDFVYNWLYFFTRANTGVPFFVHAMDWELYEELSRNKVPVYFSGWQEGYDDEYSLFRDPGFNALMAAKVLGMLEVLGHGYDMFILDTDVIVVDNFVPYFKRDVDIEFQPEYGDFVPIDEIGDIEFDIMGLFQPCGGFYFAKSNIRTRGLLQKILETYYREPEFDDQWHMKYLMKGAALGGLATYVNNTHPAPQRDGSDGIGYSVLTYRQVNPLLFPTGGLWIMQYEEYYAKLSEVFSREHPVALHANWIVGMENKKEALTVFNYWVFRDTTTEMMRGKLIHWDATKDVSLFEQIDA